MSVTRVGLGAEGMRTVVIVGTRPMLQFHAVVWSCSPQSLGQMCVFSTMSVWTACHRMKRIPNALRSRHRKKNTQNLTGRPREAAKRMRSGPRPHLSAFFHPAARSGRYVDERRMGRQSSSRFWACLFTPSLARVSLGAVHAGREKVSAMGPPSSGRVVRTSSSCVQKTEPTH